MLLVVGGALGAGYYFKVVKKKEDKELEALEEEDDDFFSESESEEEINDIGDGDIDGYPGLQEGLQLRVVSDAATQDQIVDLDSPVLVAGEDHRVLNVLENRHQIRLGVAAFGLHQVYQRGPIENAVIPVPQDDMRHLRLDADDEIGVVTSAWSNGGPKERNFLFVLKRFSK